MNGKNMPSAERPACAYPVDDLDAFSDLARDGEQRKRDESPVEELVSDGRAKNKPKSEPDRQESE